MLKSRSTEKHEPRGCWYKSHMYLIGSNFRVFFLWCLAVLFQIARFYFDFYQNHMAFWPQTSSFSFKRDFSADRSLIQLALLMCSLVYNNIKYGQVILEIVYNFYSYSKYHRFYGNYDSFSQVEKNTKTTINFWFLFDEGRRQFLIAKFKIIRVIFTLDITP